MTDNPWGRGIFSWQSSYCFLNPADFTRTEFYDVNYCQIRTVIRTFTGVTRLFILKIILKYFLYKMARQNWPEKKRMNFQENSLRDLMQIASQDNTYNYFEKEVNHLAYI